MAHKTEEYWGKETFKWGKLLNPFKIPNREPQKVRGDYGLYFGRVIEEKGVHLIIEALKNNRDIPFKIVGDGPQLIELENIVKENNLTNIEFLGSKWGDELDDVLYNAKFVVIPSVWHENFPYVILQTFAAGVPLIGSELGGIPELLKDNRGVLFNPSDISTLESSMKKLSNDTEYSNELGINGRKYLIETFNDQIFYESIIKNYNIVLK